MKGCVWLIGAGCGAMDLITVRGLNLLRRCDAVVYDDLIDRRLLDEAPAEAERIYMGKRSGKHSAPQNEISHTLVKKALEGKRVARLKGGDPYVFGRGGEETLALLEAGIPFEEVPGISSAIAIPAAAGIPVTHRGLSRSFHVITGHTADRADGLPQDMEELAKLHGTLVFLMGLSHLEQIAAALLDSGKDPETPAAVLSGGNSPHPAAVRGTLNNIAALTREAGVEAPAIILVGETAGLELKSPARPLTGVRVGLTGTDSMTGKLRPALEELGAEVSTVERSIVEKLPLELDPEELCDGKPHWLVLTSGNGVRIFFEHLKEHSVDLRRLHACRFAVIGSATGKVLERYGVHADLCPEVYTSQALGKALCAAIPEGEDAVLLRARKGAPILPELLRERSIPVREFPLYDLAADRGITETSKDRLEGLDYLTFSSGGGVELYFRTQGAVPEGTVCVCIGEVTAKALKEFYDKPFLTAEEISADGMVETILNHHASLEQEEKP